MQQQLPVRSIKEWRDTVYAESQEEFAGRIGVDPATLSQWENGRKYPRPSTRRKVATALGLKPEQVTYPGTPKWAPAAA